MAGHDVIAIGASFGGVEALKRLAADLPADLPAALLVVVHTSPESPGVLPQILEYAGRLPARHPVDGERLLPGRIYVAPPDRHLEVVDGALRVSAAARENGHRPAVDVLFRSVARWHGPHAVGVVLTGALDCGTAGLAAIKQAGGLAVVQDPADALCPDMPRHALEAVAADHVVPLAALAPLLERLTREASGPRPGAAEAPPPKPTPFSCPACGGVLNEGRSQDGIYLRCRVGHAYSALGLEEGQQGLVEAALWTALRSLEENLQLNRAMAERAAAAGRKISEKRFRQRIEAAEQHLATLRRVLGTLPPRQQE